MVFILLLKELANRFSVELDTVMVWSIFSLDCLTTPALHELLGTVAIKVLFQVFPKDFIFALVALDYHLWALQKVAFSFLFGENLFSALEWAQNCFPGAGLYVLN